MDKQSRINKHRAKWNEKQAAKTERREAIAEARAERSSEQQIVTLDRRLGKGVGAKKERARLCKV